MIVYDIANKLAKELKECPEYEEYKKKKTEVYNDNETKFRIEEFDKVKQEVQMLALKGEEQSKERMDKLQELYSILLQNSKIKEYFDAEVRFNVLLADVNKIIAEAVKEVL